MIIDCISDCHGFQPELPGGDLLIIAGDLTARDTKDEYILFIDWLSKQKYIKKIIVCGNHDGQIEKIHQECRLPDELELLEFPRMFINPFMLSGAEYLFDSKTEFQGLKMWGSPWTPTFFNFNFMKDRGAPIKEMWDMIPDDTEILITHGPAFGIQDQLKDGRLVGCEELRNVIDHRLKKLKLHVFGHIHESHGKVMVNGVIHVNASIMDKRYRPVNKPIRVIL